MKKALLAVGIVVIFLSCFTSNILARDGFGGNATGGAGAPPENIVTVTNETSLRDYAGRTGSYIITINGNITLDDSAPVLVTSNKTVKGASTSTTLTGEFACNGSGVSNVIFQNMNITHPGAAGSGNGIDILNGAHDIFITKCYMYDVADECVGITKGAYNVTVSWCKFAYPTQSGHNFSVLIGASDTDSGNFWTTFHHNWWSTGTVERMPSIRFGKIHCYNNYYNTGTTTTGYCVRVRIASEVLVQNNYYENCHDPYVLYITTGTNGKCRAYGNYIAPGVHTDSLMPGTDTLSWDPNTYYTYTLDPVAGVKAAVMAGAGNVFSGSPPTAASNPIPNSGTTDVNLTQDLSWTAGSGATSRDVYFGTVNPPVTKVIADGTVLTYAPGTMTASKTYYWRVDEKNTDGTTTGTVWNFTTVPAAPGQASSPVPSIDATGVSLTQDLSWTAGSGAASHDVYFGTVNPPPSIGNQAGTTYDTGTMTYSTIYYWRIDEKNTGGTTTGTLWSFTTVADTTPPAAPTGLTATAGYIPVILDWSNNSESDLAGYNVYRSTTSGSGYGKLNGTLLTDSNYIDDINTTDITYYYVVTAVDTTSNESDYSNEVFSGLYGDFTGNKIVSLDDLAGFVTYWLLDNCTDTAGVDLDEDCIVNFDEFAAFAENWLKE